MNSAEKQNLKTKLGNELNSDLKEAKQQLWQALIAVDGMLATVTVGIAAFGSIDNSFVKILLEIALLLLFVSIISNISIFYSYRNFRSGLAQWIMGIINDGILPTKETEDTRENHQVTLGKKIKFIEDATIVLQIVIMCLIFIIATYVLFNKKPADSQQMITVPTPTPYLLAKPQ